MYCKHCGTQLREDAVFCHSCGKRYKAAAEKPKMPVLDERKEYVDVEAYIQNMGILQKALFLTAMSAAALWSAILVLSLFLPIE